jgi:hypothetical protein
MLADVCEAAVATDAQLPTDIAWTAGLLGEVLGEGVGPAGPLALDAAEPACAQLRHVYASQCFRQWWLAPSRTRAPERLQWMEFRAKRVDLLEYVRENRGSLAVLEESVSARVHEALASAHG